MSAQAWSALLLDQHEGRVKATLRQLHDEDLPPGEVVLRIACSSLNYKDALAVLGRAKVVQSYPIVPGIDLAGTVESSSAPQFRPGDLALVTGCGIGERHWGGYAQKARIPADWIVPLPEGLTVQQAMAIGTAGFTAMLCVMALEEHGVAPGGRPVVVTGAAGGVGSVAVSLLASQGHRVIASTGRRELRDYLVSLGAVDILDRAALAAPGDKPLASEQWAGAVDTVGGSVLAGLLRSMAFGASVAACGLAGGSELRTTVMPFILRAVNLLGVSASRCPKERRLKAWERLSRELNVDHLAKMTQVIALKDVFEWSEKILRGQVRGRTVVDVNA